MAEARRANPYDPALRFWRGWALMTSRRKPYAREDLIEALVLRPRYPAALDLLEENRATLQVEILDEPFRPGALVRKNDETGEVEAFLVEDAAEPWRVWAACKALWLVDEGHREAMIGEAELVWSSAEEIECLALMLAAYDGGRQEGIVEEDPLLERLLEVAEAGDLRMFILYEIGSRIMPHVTLCLEKEERDEMRRYVKRWVVRKRRW